MSMCFSHKDGDSSGNVLFLPYASVAEVHFDCVGGEERVFLIFLLDSVKYGRTQVRESFFKTLSTYLVD